MASDLCCSEGELDKHTLQVDNYKARDKAKAREQNFFPHNAGFKQMLLT